MSNTKKWNMNLSFGLRTLLLCVLAWCVLVGMVAPHYRASVAQRRLVSEVRRAGGGIVWGLQGPYAVYIGNLPIQDRWLNNLKGVPNIYSVSVRNTHVSDSGVRVLAELPDIEVLDLSGTQVTDQGMNVLASAKTLKQVDVTGTAVTQDGIAALERAIPGIAIKTTDP